MHSEFEERIELSSFPRIRFPVDRLKQNVDNFKNCIQGVRDFLLGDCARYPRVSDSITQIKARFQETPPRFGLIQRLILKAAVEELKTVLKSKHLERVGQLKLATLQRDIPFLQDASFQNGQLGTIREVCGDVVDEQAV